MISTAIQQQQTGAAVGGVAARRPRPSQPAALIGLAECAVGWSLDHCERTDPTLVVRCVCVCAAMGVCGATIRRARGGGQGEGECECVAAEADGCGRRLADWLRRDKNPIRSKILAEFIKISFPLKSIIHVFAPAELKGSFILDRMGIICSHCRHGRVQAAAGHDEKTSFLETAI